eukprot:GHVS01057950.1.p1 GENE.GHVS01057950.1~~GHVS01057950.1.p1  ORF type:complete len:401 (+),score=64.95 GHVS01057950.1:88-1290(+)
MSSRQQDYPQEDRESLDARERSERREARRERRRIRENEEAMSPEESEQDGRGHRAREPIPSEDDSVGDGGHKNDRRYNRTDRREESAREIQSEKHRRRQKDEERAARREGARRGGTGRRPLGGVEPEELVEEVRRAHCRRRGRDKYDGYHKRENDREDWEPSSVGSCRRSMSEAIHDASSILNRTLTEQVLAERAQTEATLKLADAVTKGFSELLVGLRTLDHRLTRIEYYSGIGGGQAVREEHAGRRLARLEETKNVGEGNEKMVADDGGDSSEAPVALSAPPLNSPQQNAVDGTFGLPPKSTRRNEGNGAGGNLSPTNDGDVRTLINTVSSSEVRVVVQDYVAPGGERPEAGSGGVAFARLKVGELVKLGTVKNNWAFVFYGENKSGWFPASFLDEPS